MKRREFLQLSIGTSVTLATVGSLGYSLGVAAEEAKKLVEKDILKEGQPATISHYCLNPPNKVCPEFKEKPGNCETCMFFNKDKSLTTFKGGKYARCQILSDPAQPQFVSSKGWCGNYVKMA